MQVVETAADGLKRTLTIVVPASDLAARFETKLADLKERVQLKGFRKGHVPVVHLKKIYGRAVMSEIVEDTINDTSKRALDERNERPAMRPEIKLPETEAEVTAVLDGRSDLSYSLSFEILPRVEVTDLTKLSLEKVVAEVSPEDIEAAVGRLIDDNIVYEAEADRAAEDGDQVVIDYTGRIDGVVFEGGSAEDAEIVIGGAGFIPGFVDGLRGLKAGATSQIQVTFPEAYGNAELAGKPAVFEITVKSVGRPVPPALDDAFATSLGAKDIDELREFIRSQLQRELDRATRLKIKRELLDALDKAHDFDLPVGLVTQEFELIWAQYQRARAQAIKDGSDTADDKPEEEQREEYRRIATRRVRLGLVVGEIGERNQITVTQDELRTALIARARAFPGQERMVFEYFDKTPAAVAELRAPIYEDKVIDYVLSQVTATERKVPKQELFELAEAAANDG